MNLLWLHHPIAQALGLALLHFLWQAGLLAAGIALLLWLFKGSSPRLRYGLACSGMLALSTLPAITFHQLWNRPAPIVEREIARPPRIEVLSEPKAAATAPAAMAWRQRAQHLVDRSLPTFLISWAIGVLVLSSRLTGGWAWLQWLRRRPETAAAGDEHQLLLLRLCQRMGLVSNIRLLHCDRVEGPTVLGWLKPVVLIPGAALTGLSPQQLEMVLAHELAHILRHDYAINLIQSILEVLFFYHPAVWWLSAKIRQERELCCDDLAVRYAGDALDYARALTRLEALRLESGSPPLALALSATGGSFMHRIQRLISPTTPTPLAPRAGILALLFLALAATLSARVQPEEVQRAAPSTERYVLLRRFNEPSADGKMKAGQLYIETRGILPGQALAALSQFEAIKPIGPVTELRIPFADSDENRGSSGGLTLTADSIEGIRNVLLKMRVGWTGKDSTAPNTPEQMSTQAKGTIHLRRYDIDSPDGQSKEGTIDMRAEAVPIATIERAMGTLQKTPENRSAGHVDLNLTAEPGEGGDQYTFRFTGIAPIQVLTIIRGQAARIPIEKKPGLLVIQRNNSFTERGGLLPQGLYVSIWAKDMPADLVLQALDELEAMTPRAGIPQEVRREIQLGMGKGPKLSLDLDRVDPLEIREKVETMLEGVKR